MNIYIRGVKYTAIVYIAKGEGGGGVAANFISDLKNRPPYREKKQRLGCSLYFNLAYGVFIRFRPISGWLHPSSPSHPCVENNCFLYNVYS